MASTVNTRSKRNRIITKLPKDLDKNLFHSNSPTCRFCGKELVPFEVEILGKRRQPDWLPCDCIGFRRWSDGQHEHYRILAEMQRRGTWDQPVPERYREASGGEDYARQVESGRWLYIHGDVGVGKTHLAAAILNVLRTKGTSEFISAVDATKLDAQEPLKRAKYLVIDDLGKETASDWSVSKVWEIINHRYSEMKPTVITSQYSLEQLPERIERNGDYESAISLVSRLYEVCDTVRLSGKDRRLGVV